MRSDIELTNDHANILILNSKIVLCEMWRVHTKDMLDKVNPSNELTVKWLNDQINDYTDRITKYENIVKNIMGFDQ